MLLNKPRQPEHNADHMHFFHHTKSLFTLPLVRRCAMCKGVGLLLGILIASSLPMTLVSQVPMVRAAAIINALILSAVIGLSGLITRNPFSPGKLHPLLRGGMIAAIIHLDFIIYLWPNKGAFLQALLFAAVYGAILDLFATKLFGQGRSLTEGMIEE